MYSFTRPAAVLIVLAAGLAGCGGGSDDDPGKKPSGATSTAVSPGATRADGDTITTDEFSYAVPKGWKQSDQSTALSLAVDLEDHDGFSDNINVIRDDTVAGVGGDELEPAVEKVLTAANATDITIKDRIMIGGEEAVHVGAIFELNDKKYRTEQYAIGHGDAGYVVTVSFSESVPEAERDTVSESILTTWKWAS